jgi:tetratricopeptide (TPR) repeat protein
MKRHVAFCAVLLLCAVSAVAKTGVEADNTSVKPGADANRTAGWERPELLRQISIYEGAARDGEASHVPDGKLAKIYVELSSMYTDLAMYPKAEDAIVRAVALLRRDKEPKQGELASALDDMSMLHTSMGELNKAEKEGQEALRIRLKEGDQEAIGASYRELAALYLKRGEFKRSVEFGQRAMEAIGPDPGAHADDWVAVRYTLARAMGESGAWGRAIPVLQQGIEQTKISFGPNSLPVALGCYQLGLTYWHEGETVDAARWLERGITLMKADLSWGHPTYVNALREYARFLRQYGTEEAAQSVEREVKLADAKVDVSTMAKTQGTSSLR